MKQYEKMHVYKRRLDPYTNELILFLVTGILFAVALFGTDLVTVKWTKGTVIIAILVIILLIRYVFSSVRYNFLVAIDRVRRNYCAVTGTFVEQFIFNTLQNSYHYRGEVVPDNVDVQTGYYKVVVKSNGKIMILVSTEYFELERGNKYEFIYAGDSRALMGVRTTDGQDIPSVLGHIVSRRLFHSS